MKLEEIRKWVFQSKWEREGRNNHQESSWNSCTKSVSPYSGYRNRTGQTKASPTRWTRFPILKIKRVDFVVCSTINFLDPYAAGWHGSMLDKSNVVLPPSLFPLMPVAMPRMRKAFTNSLIDACSFFSAISAFLLFLSSNFCPKNELSHSSIYLSTELGDFRCILGPVRAQFAI